MTKKFLLALVLLASVACSDDKDDKPAQAPAPAPAPAPDSCAQAWAAVKAVIMKNCAGCHNGTKQPSLLPRSAFDASPVAAKVDSGAMPPPPRKLSEEDEEALDAYLICVK